MPAKKNGAQGAAGAKSATGAKGVKEGPATSSGLEAPYVLEVKAAAFKDTCLTLLDQVYEHAMEVVVTKHGTPVARVVAPDAPAPSPFGFMRGTVLGHGDIVSPDPDAWGDLA
ncbi:MAG TPA: type II toxin-antitoxin system prevent-host-death family antitoxin [Gemmatimonadaceae bacterium]|nr:type II toxin-antitoxin system prevent-host-death family antitoxin [Gemmatimonadaceae bacterium]